MKWSEILRQNKPHKWIGTDLGLHPSGGLIYSIRDPHCGPPYDDEKDADPFLFLNCSEDHGPWEYSDDPDIITFGCSVTAGQNLPRVYTWPQIIQTVDGLKVNAIGKSGSSIQMELSYVAMAIRKYGAPRQILGLVPNLDRAWIPRTLRHENEIYVDARNMIYLPEIRKYVTLRDLFLLRIKPEYKDLAPLDGISIDLPPQIMIWHTHQLLDAWETMTSISGIEFTISSWHESANDLLHQIYPCHRTPDYPRDPDGDWRVDPRWGAPPEPSCGHEPQNGDQARYWLRADDDLHPGLHHHLHFYETLTGRRIRNEQIALL